MRLRSSQFVFLLLLVCSVQIREEYASNLLADAISGHATLSAQHRESAAAGAEPGDRLKLHLVRSAQTIRLSASGVAARRVAWSMTRPALATTATVSHTSFLRA
jgi:hypothetical protein